MIWAFSSYRPPSLARAQPHSARLSLRLGYAITSLSSSRPTTMAYPSPLHKLVAMVEKETEERKKHIVFFHPDLGIGGAERLIIDAAVGLQKRGHRVTIFTSHCDSRHCFDEARDGSYSFIYVFLSIANTDTGTLDVRIRGNILIPAHFFSRFAILCAIARQFHLILQIRLSGELDSLTPNVFFIDQLSAGIPLLGYLFPAVHTLFYCHFPDLLLAKGRQNPIKALYRMPFDWFEKWSTSFADSIVVNSGFTKSIVEKQWPGLAKKKELEIVYPCVDVSPPKAAKEENDLEWRDKNIILSINRFEEKKNIGLAIKAFAGLPKRAREGVRLVVAGGYDHRVQENVVYHQDLLLLAKELGLKSASTGNIVTALSMPDDVDVLFLMSVPKALKDALLRSARLLVYTPSYEHFGIVPLEAMLVGTPVLATNTGGPLETVVDGETGWLRDPEDTAQWTEVMNMVLHKLQPETLAKVSESGKRRVKEVFSQEKMAESLDEIMTTMVVRKKKLDTEPFTLLVFTLGAITATMFSIWYFVGDW